MRALLALLLACTPTKPPAAVSAVDLAACDCPSPDAWCGRFDGCCTPVDPVHCTDCDCDGYLAGDDCDDGNGLVHPGAVEYVQCDMANPAVHGGPDGIDNDCDGIVDEDADPAEEVCDGIDDDCDGEIDEDACDSG
jgi:hypothetical protein